MGIWRISGRWTKTSRNVQRSRAKLNFEGKYSGLLYLFTVARDTILCSRVLLHIWRFGPILEFDVSKLNEPIELWAQRRSLIFLRFLARMGSDESDVNIFQMSSSKKIIALMPLPLNINQRPRKLKQKYSQAADSLANRSSNFCSSEIPYQYHQLIHHCLTSTPQLVYIYPYLANLYIKKQ